LREQPGGPEEASARVETWHVFQQNRRYWFEVVAAFAGDGNACPFQAGPDYPQQNDIRSLYLCHASGKVRSGFVIGLARCLFDFLLALIVSAIDCGASVP
jgi:hypothetical protein